MFGILPFEEGRMPRHLVLRPLRRGEQRALRSKLRDLTLSVRVHQRYRVLDQVQRGLSLFDAAERIGCHFTVAYDWVHRFNETGFSTFEQFQYRRSLSHSQASPHLRLSPLPAPQNRQPKTRSQPPTLI